MHKSRNARTTRKRKESILKTAYAPSFHHSTIPFLSLLLFPILNPQLPTFGQGSLTPPSPPGATMKTLQQVEPRTPISIVPTNLAVSGSYYLVTNLPGVAASDGITISANDVDLDLNGFVLAGAPGSGTGISVPAFQTNLGVRHGQIRGW